MSNFKVFKPEKQQILSYISLIWFIDKKVL